MSVLAVASISARLLAETARQDGFEVVALDLFGDADTRRACTAWHCIGEAAPMDIDGHRLLAALRQLAHEGRVAGWIAGAGFEGQPDLLAHGAAMLPLLGTPADAVRRLRDPHVFFDFLATHGVTHPPVRSAAPDDAAGWLVKDAQGCGGWHIRRADAPGASAWAAASRHRYHQREVSGVPMSATFIANGRDALVLGFNQLTVRPLAGRPCVYCGVVGPVPLPAGVAAHVTATVRAAAQSFGLRGLGSLDFMREGDTVNVLEINPRPPASMALYAARGGLLAAHVRACTDGALPQGLAPAAGDEVHGTETVFAPHRLRLDEAAAHRLAAQPDCHDVPAAATAFEPGDPVCSVSACSTSPQAVRALLARRREAVLHQCMETSE